MNITSDGHFALNLRAEYFFTWNDDSVKLAYIRGGKVYEATLSSLKALYDSVVVNGETVLLKEL